MESSNDEEAPTRNSICVVVKFMVPFRVLNMIRHQKGTVILVTTCILEYSTAYEGPNLPTPPTVKVEAPASKRQYLLEVQS